MGGKRRGVVAPSLSQALWSRRMLRFERALIAAGERFEGHGHKAAHALVVLQGDVTERLGRHDQLVRSGDFRISPAGAAHDLTFGASGADCLIIEAEGPFWGRVFTRRLRGARAINLFGGGAMSDRLAQLKGADDVLAQSGSIQALGQLFAVRHDADRPHWFDEAVDLIDRGEIRLLSQVASTLGRDNVHMARAFGAYFGFRPVEYRAMRRAWTALSLVRSADASLAEIALTCGYAHQSHMTRAFRSLLGHPPSHWRA
jgi:AraC family transcriptional regulator